MQSKFLAPPGDDRKPAECKRKYRPQKKRQGLPALSLADRELFEECRAIRDKYDDGIPLSPEDRKVVLSALRKHPKGREKFGAGVQAVVVDKFVGGTRCFFVVRADGTAEDFSLRKCFWDLPNQSKPVRAQMDTFNYGRLVTQFRSWLKARRS